MYENVFYGGAGKFVSHGEWIHPDRTITSYEIIFVLSGSVFISEDDRRYHLRQNDLLLLEPNRHHFGYEKSAGTSFFWMHFTGNAPPDPALKYQNIREPYHLLLLFKQLLHYRCENRSGECLDYLTRVILIECFSPRIQRNANRLTEEIAAWIHANRDTNLRVSQISDHFGLNTDYISRVFKAHSGRSLKEYINDVRMDHIRQLLLTSDWSLSEIAYSAGFQDYKYFLKFFRYHEGITPTQFLKAYPKTHVNKQ